MKKISIILVIILCIPFAKAKSQTRELGKVTIAELQQKFHPKDTSAVAAILFKKGKVSYEYTNSQGFEMITEVITKIKIYKKQGYEWANKAIEYYTDGFAEEKLYFDDAITYNLVNGKIEKVKLKSEGIFDVKINKYWKQKKITMPNVKEGSIIEFSYKVSSNSFSQLKDWQFQEKIPVNYSEFKTHTPEYFVYKPVQKGYVFPKKTELSVFRTINYLYRPKWEVGADNSTSNQKLEFIEKQLTYTIVDVPAIKEEDFVDNLDNYTASISHELSVIKFPNAPYRTFSENWESVTKKIYEYDNFGPELNKTGYFEDDLAKLLEGVASNEEKIVRIFEFVKSKVKWNNYLGYACSDGVKKAYRDGVGNVAEINLMLTAMLRHANIDANPVILSTKKNGIALFASLAAFNYVITAVEIPDGLILLDATEKFSIPDILPLRDLNWDGRLIRKDGSSTLVPLVAAKIGSEIISVNCKIETDNKIEGNFKRQYTNHNAMLFRSNNLGLNEDMYLEKLENKYNNIEVANYKRENEKEYYKPITESFDYKDSNGIEKIGGKMYISPLFFLTTKNNPFKQEVREYPIDFGFPNSKQYIVNIEIPDGYVVESMPTSIKIDSEESIVSFKYLTQNTQNVIQLMVSSITNHPFVGAEYYSVLKDFYKSVIQKEEEKIVLVKK